MNKERDWRTREDSFKEMWEKVRSKLELKPQAFRRRRCSRISSVVTREHGIPFLDVVSQYGGTRIACRNVTLLGHWCHLVRIGEDFHNRLGVSPGVQNNRPEIRKRLQERASPRS